MSAVSRLDSAVGEFFRAKGAANVTYAHTRLANEIYSGKDLLRILTSNRELVKPYASIELNLAASEVVCEIEWVRSYNQTFQEFDTLCENNLLNSSHHVFACELEEIVATKAKGEWTVVLLCPQVPYRYEIQGEDYVVERKLSVVQVSDSDVVGALARDFKDSGFKYVGNFDERSCSFRALNWKTGAEYRVKLSVYHRRGLDPLCQLSINFVGNYKEFPESSRLCPEEIVREILSIAQHLESSMYTNGVRYKRTKFTVCDWLAGKVSRSAG